MVRWEAEEKVYLRCNVAWEAIEKVHLRCNVVM